MAQESANALPVLGSFPSNRQRDLFFFQGCAATLGEQQTPERPQIVQQSAARVHMILQLVQLVVHQMEGLQPTFRLIDLVRDRQLLETARDEAARWFDASTPTASGIDKLVANWEQRFKLIEVG